MDGRYELDSFTNKAAWKKTAKKAMAAAAQAEHEEQLHLAGGEAGGAYLAINPGFGRAPCSAARARCSKQIDR
jgi:hypothetical protein